LSNKRIKIMMNVFIVFMLCTAMIFTSFAMEPVIDEPDLPYWFDDKYKPGYHYEPGQLIVGIVDGVRLSKEELNNYSDLFPGVDILQVSDIADLPHLAWIDHLSDGQALLLVLANKSKDHMLKAMRTLEQNQFVKFVELNIYNLYAKEFVLGEVVILLHLTVAEVRGMTIEFPELDSELEIVEIINLYETVMNLTPIDQINPDIREQMNNAKAKLHIKLAVKTKESVLEAIIILMRDPRVISADPNYFLSPAPDDPIIPDLDESDLTVECYAGDRKATLLWRGTSAGIGRPAAYLIKVDDGEWITIDRSDLLFDKNAEMYFYTFHGLTNGVEYTFQVRAANHMGTSGPSQETKATPESIGSIGGNRADLISIHGVPVMPVDGWPLVIGGPGLSVSWPYEATIELPQTIRYSTVHINDIVVSQDATFELFASWRWSNNSNIPPVNLIDRIDDNYDWCSETVMYIKVRSANREQVRYYVITVN